MIPPMGKAETKLKVRYRRKPPGAIYQAGELASWGVDEARRLVAAGIAEPVGWRMRDKPEREPDAA